MSPMNGTTRCPHCETRFKITEEQLTAHHGMVRCGHCLQAFDARPDFIPEQPSPQLDLPIDATHHNEAHKHYEPPVHEINAFAEPLEQPETLDTESAEPEIVAPTDPQQDSSLLLIQSEPDDTLDFSLMEITRPAVVNAAFADALHAEAKYRAELPTEHATHDAYGETVPAKRRTWPWAVGIFMAAILLGAQSVYFFRISLAAHLPATKPALMEYCLLLGCSLPLPQQADLMSIESSSLDADPAHDNQVTLNALLRNRAGYTLAFPALALTLNDSQDKPLARRLLLPSEYLPADETEKTGFFGNHEVNIKLALHIGDLRPVGYRLELFYDKAASPRLRQE